MNGFIKNERKKINGPKNMDKKPISSTASASTKPKTTCAKGISTATTPNGTIRPQPQPTSNNGLSNQVV